MLSSLFAIAVGLWLLLFPVWVRLGLIPRRWAGSERELGRAGYLFAVIWVEAFGVLAILVGIASFP